MTYREYLALMWKNREVTNPKEALEWLIYDFADNVRPALEMNQEILSLFRQGNEGDIDRDEDLRETIAQGIACSLRMASTHIREREIEAFDYFLDSNLQPKKPSKERRKK